MPYKVQKKQIERLKERGYYGTTQDPKWNKEKQQHDCCGSPRSYYHRKNCPLCEWEE